MYKLCSNNLPATDLPLQSKGRLNSSNEFDSLIESSVDKPQKFLNSICHLGPFEFCQNKKLWPFDQNEVSVERVDNLHNPHYVNNTETGLYL